MLRKGGHKLERDRTRRENLLAALRALGPQKRLPFEKSVRLAELQAERLITMTGLVGPPFPTEIITELPRVTVWMERETPVSASTHWDGKRWVIVVNGAEDVLRRRYSLVHELKHIIDHPVRHLLYGHGEQRLDVRDQAEWAAEFFAACVLMPRRWILELWASGCRSVEGLSDHFQVTERAIENRLKQLGLPIHHTQGGLAV